ncbi:MAG: phytoene desaturase family protein [Actinobacteria bacterium]|nr:phytoene desaturase family protein [Actinomycetota bacterium]
MARVIVIGAGVAGMATAARLRVKRHDVTVLEQSPTYGGKLGTYERDGFVFDTGPSLLTLPAVYRDLFLSTGSALDDALDIVPLEPAFRYRWSDGTIVEMPGAGPALCADALGDALGGHAADDWRALIDRASAIWELTRRPVLESPLEGPRDLLSMARRPRDIRTVAPFTSLRSLGQKLMRDPRLVTLLDRYATYTGSDPRRAPAALVTVPYVEQVFGAWHIGGGIRRLADALYERGVERGVDYRFSTDVAQIRTDGGRVCGVELVDGSRLDADIVVANADAQHVYDDLLDPTLSSARAPRRQLARATPSLSGFVMLLAVRGRTPGLQHHNVWFPANYDAEFDSVFGTGRQRTVMPVDDPTIYVCSPNDPLMRPDADHESWFVLINAPRHGSGAPGTGTIDWNEPGLAQSYADRTLAVLASRGCDVRDRVLWREIFTPAALEAHTRAPGGAIYGSSSNGARSAFLRPSNRSPVPGLFLVGGSAHPGGGLPLVGLSAGIVADLIGRAE